MGANSSALSLVPLETPPVQRRRCCTCCGDFTSRLGAVQRPQSAVDPLLPPPALREQRRCCCCTCCGDFFVDRLGVLQTWDQWVPAWGRDLDTQRAAEEYIDRQIAAGLERPGAHVTLFNVAGPALAMIGKNTVALWIWAFLTPSVTYAVSSCPDSCQPFAVYNWKVIIPWIGMYTWSTRCEWKALKNVIIPYAQALYPLRVLGVGLTHKGWLVLHVVVSTLAKLDLMFNGLLLAKLLLTHDCNGEMWKILSLMWERVIRHSMVSWVPFLTSLPTVALIAWCLTFCQIIVVGLQVYPVEGIENTNYGPNSEKEGYKTLWSDATVWHADSLKRLADVNRMVSIGDPSLALQLQRAEQLFDKAERLPPGPNRDRYYKRAFAAVATECSRTSHRIMYFTLAERALILELQTSLFAISRALMPTSLTYRFDLQTLVLLVFSFVSFAKTVFVDHRDQRRQIKRVREEVLEPKRYHSADTRSQARATDKYLRRFGYAYLAVVLIFAHCVAKFALAFFCEDSLWNLPLPFLGAGRSSELDAVGCVVNLGDLLEQLRGETCPGHRGGMANTEH